jgi:hypothetical protein
VSAQGEPLNLYEFLMGDEVGEVPVPRSFEETVATVSRAQDEQDSDARKRSEKLAAQRAGGPVDATDVATFLGRGHSHADVISNFSELADRADKWQAHLAEQAAKKAERERQEASQRRIAELEAELATTATRAEQLGRHFHEAVEGWGRARQEAASFRDAHYRSAYR